MKFIQNGETYELLVDSDIEEKISNKLNRIFVTNIEGLPKVFVYSLATKKVRELVDVISKCKPVKKLKASKSSTDKSTSVTTNWFILCKNGNYLDLRRENIVYIAKPVKYKEFESEKSYITQSSIPNIIVNRNSSGDKITYPVYTPIKYNKSSKQLDVFCSCNKKEQVEDNIIKGLLEQKRVRTNLISNQQI